MRIIPKKHQLKLLSVEDQNFWRGYFEGFEAATLLEERKTQEELNTEPMSLGEAMQIAKAIPYGPERDAFFHRQIELRRRLNPRPGEELVRIDRASA